MEFQRNERDGGGTVVFVTCNPCPHMVTIPTHTGTVSRGLGADGPEITLSILSPDDLRRLNAQFTPA